ncbi:MAG: DUF5985 family protein [Gemmatimonadaceae bacterium]
MRIADVVYLLCALTSFAAAALLARGYWQSRTRLLLWSSLCFAGLALSNFLLVLDLTLFPGDLELFVIRQVPALIGLALLLYGLIWDGAD